MSECLKHSKFNHLFETRNSDFEIHIAHSVMYMLTE